MCDRFEEDFKFLWTVAHKIISYIPDEEQLLARMWVDKLSTYSSINADMARTRGEMMREIIDVLRQELFFRVMNSRRGKKFDDAVQAQLKMECDHFGEPSAVFPIIQSVFPMTAKRNEFMRLWSPDKKTYLAAKPIGGGGTLIYMAVTQYPELGWDLPDPTYTPNLCVDL